MKKYKDPKDKTAVLELQLSYLWVFVSMMILGDCFSLSLSRRGDY